MTMRNAHGVAMGLVLGMMIGLEALASDEPSIGRGVGQRVDNFTLRDVASGELVSLYSFRGKRAGVLVFTGTDCPVSNLYLPRLVELARAYEEKGVVVLAINANAHESEAEVAEHARANGLDFPVLKDPGNVVADQLKAERTCEALVLDGKARLRYRGAIDDQYGLGTRKDGPSQSYVAEALDAVLAGREVATTSTPVVGCPIDRVDVTVSKAIPRVRPASPDIVAALEAIETPVKVGEVTYAADVAPILQAKCQSCHRPGQVGPFALLTYDQARRWAAAIYEVVDDRRMPPWHADPRYGKFENDRSLTPRERATLVAWVEQGTPLGDPRDLPPPRTFPEGWTIGTPDVIFQIPEPYTVAAQGVLPYQRFRVPTGFTEDKWVQAAEARPGDRSVVHHIIVYVAEPDRNEDLHGSADAHLCGYAPGDMPSIYPPGTAKRIPAGSDLIFEMHYTPIGRVRTDQSSVALIFARQPVTRQAFTKGIAQTRFVIPPGAENFPVESSFTFPDDAHLLSFMPHMHLRGKDFRYTAACPDGTSEVLLSVPAYDFGWQSTYRLAEPKAMPKGTRIDCLAHFDNSEGNPANPDPTKAVRWGQQTFDEMMIGYIDYVEDKPVDPRALARSAAARRPSSLGDSVREGGLLLLNPGVQRELKLNAEQVAKVQMVVQEARERHGADLQKLSEVEGLERLDRARELIRLVSAEMKHAFAEILSPEQGARFEQIQLQRRGAEAFTDPEIQERLHLTAEQKEKIRALRDEVRTELGEILQDRQDLAARLATLRREMRERAFTLLSADQKAIWDRLTGEAFDFESPRARAASEP
jgi:peroxiredoxin/mono/diheme cytochrome c family protein